MSTCDRTPSPTDFPPTQRLTSKTFLSIRGPPEFLPRQGQATRKGGVEQPTALPSWLKTTDWRRAVPPVATTKHLPLGRGAALWSYSHDILVPSVCPAFDPVCQQASTARCQDHLLTMDPGRVEEPILQDNDMSRVARYFGQRPDSMSPGLVRRWILPARMSSVWVFARAAEATCARAGAHRSHGRRQGLCRSRRSVRKRLDLESSVESPSIPCMPMASKSGRSSSRSMNYSLRVVVDLP